MLHVQTKYKGDCAFQIISNKTALSSETGKGALGFFLGFYTLCGKVLSLQRDGPVRFEFHPEYFERRFCLLATIVPV